MRKTRDLNVRIFKRVHVYRQGAFHAVCTESVCTYVKHIKHDNFMRTTNTFAQPIRYFQNI